MIVREFTLDDSHDLCIFGHSAIVSHGEMGPWCSMAALNQHKAVSHEIWPLWTSLTGCHLWPDASFDWVPALTGLIENGSFRGDADIDGILITNLKCYKSLRSSWIHPDPHGCCNDGTDFNIVQKTPESLALCWGSEWLGISPVCTLLYYSNVLVTSFYLPKQGRHLPSQSMRNPQFSLKMIQDSGSFSLDINLTSGMGLACSRLAKGRLSSRKCVAACSNHWL